MRSFLLFMFPGFVLGFLSVANCQAELVTNGEFEDPVISADWQARTDVTAWDTTDPDPPEIELWKQGVISSPADGTDSNGTGQHCELGYAGADTISQSFAIPVGHTQASFSFDWWPRTTDQTVAWSVVGSSSGTIDSATESETSNSTWFAVSRPSLTVVSGETITLSFTGNSGSAAHIDQVSFVSVPEPTTLLLIGIGAAGMIAKRRR
jgi:hypothetical protein